MPSRCALCLPILRAPCASLLPACPAPRAPLLPCLFLPTAPAFLPAAPAFLPAAPAFLPTAPAVLPAAPLPVPARLGVAGKPPPNGACITAPFLPPAAHGRVLADAPQVPAAQEAGAGVPTALQGGRFGWAVFRMITHTRPEGNSRRRPVWPLHDALLCTLLDTHHHLPANSFYPPKPLPRHRRRATRACAALATLWACTA